MRLTVSPIVCFATLLAVTVFVANSPSEPQETPPRTYLGFDRNDYPGDDAMKLLRRDFAFTGYWLGSPPDDTTNSWTGKRELLRSEGFGFVLLFAGPTSGQLRDQPYTRKRVADDTQAAAAAARREGFPPGSVIFLDIEEGGRLPSTYFTYLKAWASELERLGFRAGVYCSGIPIDEGEGLTLITSDFIREKIKPTELSIGSTTMPVHLLPVAARRRIHQRRPRAASPSHRSGNSYVRRATSRRPATAEATPKLETAMRR